MYPWPRIFFANFRPK